MNVESDTINVLDWLWDQVAFLFDTPGQLTFLVILVGIFIVFLFKIREDKYLWNQITAWLRVSIGGLIVVTVLLYTSPLIAPEADPFLLYRVLHLRVASFTTGLVLLIGAVLAVGVIFPSGMIRKIEEWPPGATIIFATIIATLGYLMTYS